MRKFKRLILFCILAAPLLALASVTVTVNGSNHTIPQTNERGWGNAVTAWIQSISQYTLQPTGGTFSLTADVDFGSSYGLKSSYLSTRTANPSSAGLLRLAKTDYIGWRNNANSSNLLLAIDSNDNLTFNGSVLATASASGFIDTGFFVVDASDATKRMGVNAGGATGTTSTLTFAQTANRAITFPDATTTLVGTDTTQTLTNKTLTSPAITTPTGIVKGDVGLGNVDNTSDATKNAASVTLTNKTISGASNTITNVSLTAGVTGTLPVANGGTGQITANAALNGFLPTQTSNATKFLQTDGTNTSWATAALTVQGQDEGSGVTTTTLKAPYNQFTTTGSAERLVETGYNNLLANPSFEHSTYSTGWGALGSTTPAVETTVVRHGKKSTKLTTSSQSGNFWFQSVTPTIQMQGMNMEYGMAVKTSVSGIQVCALQAGSVVGSCSTVVADNVWRYYPVNYPGPSSGTVGVTLYAASGVTGDIYVDDTYVGQARNLGNVAQAQLIGSIKYTATASCAWTRTSASLGNFSADTDCPTPTVTGQATAPGTKIPALTFASLPPGDYYFVATNNFTGTAGSAISYRFSDGTNNTATQSFYVGAGTPSTSVISGRLNYTTTQSNVTFNIQGAATTSDAVLSTTTPDLEISVYYFPTASQTIASTAQSEFNETDCPTITGSWVSNTTYTCKWSRRKNRAYFDIKVATSGAPTSANLTVNLPITIDTAKMTTTDFSAPLGQLLANDSGTTGYNGWVTYSSSTAVGCKIFVSGTETAFSNVTQAAPFTFGSGDSLTLKFDVPVSGWIDNPVPVTLGSVIGSTTVYSGIGSGVTSIDAGTYSATVTNVANSASITTPQTVQYLRVGNIVTVGGAVQSGCTTAASTDTTFNITLPVASTFTLNSNLGGALGSGQASENGRIYAVNSSGMVAQVNFKCQATGAALRTFNFTYIVQ